MTHMRTKRHGSRTPPRSVTPPGARATEPYVRGRSGHTRPAPGDTYVLDKTEHRFDGKCHDACENVR